MTGKSLRTTGLEEAKLSFHCSSTFVLLLRHQLVRKCTYTFHNVFFIWQFRSRVDAGGEGTVERGLLSSFLRPTADGVSRARHKATHTPVAGWCRAFSHPLYFVCELQAVHVKVERKSLKEPWENLVSLQNKSNSQKIKYHDRQIWHLTCQYLNSVRDTWHRHTRKTAPEWAVTSRGHSFAPQQCSFIQVLGSATELVWDCEGSSPMMTHLVFFFVAQYYYYILQYWCHTTI